MKPQIQNEIGDWLDMMVGLFGDDFYLEMQPSTTEEQIYVNQELIKISQAMGIKYIITTDAHYLNEEQRSIHELYLKADEGEREVASFYNSTFVMSAQKIHEYMDESIGAENVNIGLMNTLEIQAKCSDYTITSPIKLPYLPRKTYEKTPEIEANYKELIGRIPTLKSFWESENLAERDFSIRLLEQYGKKFDDSEEKCKRIEEELKILLDSSRKNNMVWAAYLLQISDYINIYWTEGDSIVLPGRGSGVGFYLNYLLDIIQIDATREKAPLKPWRFLNPERASVLDIDIDVESAKRQKCIAGLQKVYGEQNVVRVCTFNTEGSRAAIQTSARALGIDIDVAKNVSSMVSASRGITYTLSQVYYGDEKNGIKPNTLFVQEMEKYPEWWAMMQAIEGLVRGVGIHAGGVVIVDEPFTNHNSIMKTPDGEIISQFELHDLEDLGQIKIDLLAVEGADKIRTTLDLLIKYGYVEKKDTLRETYESVIGVYNLEREAPEMWDMLHKNKIVSLFQMEQESGIRGIALTKPTSVEDLATLNSVIRLMSSEKGAETPLEKYARFHNNKREWYEEMDYYGLSLSEKKLIEKHLDASCGICESQEGMMSLLLEPEVTGWSLGKVDIVRKAVAKFWPIKE